MEDLKLRNQLKRLSKDYPAQSFLHIDFTALNVPVAMASSCNTLGLNSGANHVFSR